jgi:hypothetical protein
MPLMLVSAIALYAFSVVRMVTAALEAPIGFEDAEGFHYGMPVTEPAGELVER